MSSPQNTSGNSINEAILRQLKDAVLHQTQYVATLYHEPTMSPHFMPLYLTITNPPNCQTLIVRVYQDQIIISAIKYNDRQSTTATEPNTADKTKTIKDTNHKHKTVSLHEQDYVEQTIKFINEFNS